MQEYVTFSDGNPVFELLVFAAVLAVSFLLTFWTPVRKVLDSTSVQIVDFVKRRNALPVGSVAFETFKLDIVRIAIGGIATWRYGDILSGALQSGNSNAIAFSGAATLMAALVTVGLLTRIFSLLLMATANTIIDNFLGASTLGTMVMSMTLLMFAMAPAGRTLSLDALIFRKRETSTDQFVIAKLAALLAYYCVCLYSVFWHVHDEAWTSLSIIGWVMLSPAANPNYATVAWKIYEWSPVLFVNFVRLSILGMLAWYVLVLPGLFLGWVTRYFVILWGLTFFLISALVLPLSYLGWYELMLWAALFVPPFRTGWVATKAPQIAGMPGAISGALMITLLVMVCFFVVRLPVTSVQPDQSPPASWSKQLVGAAPAALGIHKINVFNKDDLAVFSFRWYNYTAPDTFDLTNLDRSQLTIIPVSRTILTDATIYGIARHSRRVARENVGCDREYFQSILPYMQAMFRDKPGEKHIAKVVSSRSLSTFPTTKDFATYAQLVRREFPLCRALFDLEKGEVSKFVFLQPGLDEKLRREDIPPIFDSQHFEPVLNYSCSDDGRFLWALASNRPEQQDPSLIAAVTSVTADVFGRFELSCLMEVRQITESLPQLLSDQFVPVGDTCNAGIALLTSLKQALATSPEIDVSADITKATTARDAGQYKTCITAALNGRAAYWQAIML